MKRHAFGTLKLGEQQNKSLQPEATDKSLHCSTGDHLVGLRSKIAQAASHHLLKHKHPASLAGTMKLFFRDNSGGSN